MSDRKFSFAEKHFRIDGTKVQPAGGGDCYIYLQFGSELVYNIKNWALAAATAEYIQADSVYAGQFTDDEAYALGVTVREKMAEFACSEEEAIDDAVAEYRVANSRSRRCAA